MSLAANLVVNAAGLGATALAKRTDMGAAAQAATPNLHLSKGNYFTLSARAPFSRLIYPVAKHATLGVHLTLDLGGQARFGPDIEWLDPAVQDPLQVDMRVDPTRAAAFEQSVRRFWPELPADALMPGFCGLRPKIHGPGEPLRDFVVQGVADHGVPGLVQLFGIESPGLTSCIALARHTLKLLALEPAPA
jgi:L-2-hydroxyglutarate oxidase LhgO